MAGQLKLEDLQSFEELFAPRMGTSLAAQKKQEKRRSDRKVVEAKGSLTLDGAVLSMEAMDLSLGGLSLRANKQLGVGKECHVSFSLAPQSATISATARIVYCFYTGEQDFRAGLEFLTVSTGSEALKQFVAS